MTKNKCKYCGKVIPEKAQDTVGRKHTKTTEFCRGTNHYRLWWNKEHKEHKQIQDSQRYLERKEKNAENTKKPNEPSRVAEGA